jgi:hypothetical protein
MAKLEPRERCTATATFRVEGSASCGGSTSVERTQGMQLLSCFVLFTM